MARKATLLGASCHPSLWRVGSVFSLLRGLQNSGHHLEAHTQGAYFYEPLGRFDRDLLFRLVKTTPKAATQVQKRNPPPPQKAETRGPPPPTLNQKMTTRCTLHRAKTQTPFGSCRTTYCRDPNKYNRALGSCIIIIIRVIYIYIYITIRNPEE